MPNEGKNPVIDLPVKITLTSEGVEWFIRNKRPLKRLRMANNQVEYGISLNNFTAESLQKMINIDYIASVELARVEFTSKRREITDLSKLIVYRMLYKAFGRVSFDLFLSSPLIKRWNRANPTKIIDSDSSINQQYVEAMLMRVAGEIPEVSSDIQRSIIYAISEDSALSPEEKRLKYYLVDRFLISMPNIIWCLLVLSKGQRDYLSLIAEIRRMIGEYLEKASIVEYLALMIVEVLSFTEASHYLQVANELIPGNRRLESKAILRPEIRRAAQLYMAEQNDYLYLTYQIGGKVASIGTQNRLWVTVFNRVQEYRKMKDRVEKRMDVEVRERSLFDFYQETPEVDFDPELGLYYLSYLNEACAKQNVRFDSKVNQLPRSDLTIITATLQF